MAIKAGREFRLFLRRPAGSEGRYAIRYSVEEGYGMLSMHGRKVEPTPTASGETHDLDTEALRGGRFVHLLPSGNKRQSYSFERLAHEVLGGLPEDRWVELETLNEFGFRYLVPTGEGSASSTSSIPPTGASRLASSGATPARVAGPPAPAARAAAPARPHRAIDAPMPEAALASMPHAAAIDRLRDELARNAELTETLAELETRLQASLLREQDLIEVLGRWQEREIGK